MNVSLLSNNSDVGDGGRILRLRLSWILTAPAAYS